MEAVIIRLAKNPDQGSLCRFVPASININYCLTIPA